MPPVDRGVDADGGRLAVTVSVAVVILSGDAVSERVQAPEADLSDLFLPPDGDLRVSVDEGGFELFGDGVVCPVTKGSELRRTCAIELAVVGRKRPELR